MCNICSKESINDNCSIEHGMAFRYLKKFKLNKSSIQEIVNIKTNYTIKTKYKIWQMGLSIEPRCLICDSKLTFKKINNEVFLCSKECKNKYKESNQHKCVLCNLIKCYSNCSSKKRELKKFSMNVDEYIIFLQEKYKNYNIEEILHLNRLYINNLNSDPKCKFCGAIHRKSRHQKFSLCCSKECSNVYQSKKVSYKEICKYYINKGICEKFVHSINIYELSKIYNTKRIDIHKCDCGNYNIGLNPCCILKKRFNNIEYLNKDYFRSFIKNKLFNIKKAMKFYNCSESSIRRLKAKYNIDERCKNTIEDELYNKFSKYTKIKRNDRILIKPKEIDFLFNNFAIEYNGLMWHSDGNSKSAKFNHKNNKNKHLNKTELVEETGYQLFHIFENEWINNKEKWISVINNKLNNSKKLFARKCTIEEIGATKCSAFEEANHLQGKGLSSIRIGLFYNSEIVSVMTFGKSRFNKKYQFELIRFCTKLNTTVVGGASKLLKYFERKYKPRSIISYANRRWSTGNLYDKLNFTFSHNSGPNYFYFRVGENILYSRNMFQKHKLKDKLKLFNSELTETENMFNNSFRKIFDCGNKVYVKHYDTYI